MKMGLSATRWVAICLLAVPLLCPSVARSGEWRVAPIRLDFGDAKSGVLTVVNEAAEKLQIQVKAYEWTQDAEGKDQYAETKDIIYFPRFLIFDKAEERIVRAGIRMPATAREKTYRLFLEEVPEPQKAEGANVAIAIRFGVPVFVKPIKEEARGEIGMIGMSEGAIHARVKNTGNLHFIVRSVVVKGKNLKGEEIFSKEIDGWYLLAGASRPYTTTVPREVCPDLARIDVVVTSDKLTMTADTAVDKSMCPP